MAAIAAIEDLQAVAKDLAKFEKDNPEGFTRMVDLLKTHRKVGYKNIIRMAYGDKPEDLKQ